jgi:Flp pilus assembly protein TadD
VKWKSDDPLSRYLLGKALALGGNLDDGIIEFQESLRLKHDNPEVCEALAEAWVTKGNNRAAIEQYRKVLLLQPNRPKVLNAVAWLLATDGNAEVRKPEEAVELAQRACQLTENNQATILDTLAACYASAGRFPQAIQTARAAQELALAAQDRALGDKLAARLQLYLSNQAYYSPSKNH